MPCETRQHKLLIVDDEPLIRQTLSFCLRDEYEVTAVASGEEAIEASKKESFPVVILDLCMGGISGIETLKRLKELHEVQNVIILTAYESMETAIDALNFGAFNYLTKPFERGRLKEVVSKGFELYEQQNLRKKDMQNRLMTVHDAFFSLLCHEFNTPLNVVLGFAELLSCSVKDAEQASWVQEIKDSGNHLHKILMEIVEYIASAHLATAGIQKEFSLRNLLQPIFPAFREQGIKIEVNGGIAWDHSLIGQSESILMISRKLVSMASHLSKLVHVEARVGDVDAEGLPSYICESLGLVFPRRLSEKTRSSSSLSLISLFPMATMDAGQVSGWN